MEKELRKTTWADHLPKALIKEEHTLDPQQKAAVLIESRALWGMASNECKHITPNAFFRLPPDLESFYTDHLIRLLDELADLAHQMSSGSPAININRSAFDELLSISENRKTPWGES